LPQQATLLRSSGWARLYYHRSEGSVGQIVGATLILVKVLMVESLGNRYSQSTSLKVAAEKKVAHIFKRVVTTTTTTTTTTEVIIL